MAILSPFINCLLSNMVIAAVEIIWVQRAQHLFLILNMSMKGDQLLGIISGHSPY